MTAVATPVAIDWLIRPFAHRGLHDAAKGVLENTSSAVQAAIDAGYGFEIDLQEAADGVPVVFHDPTLDRLTVDSGPLIARSSRELTGIAFKATADRMQTLDELLEQVAGAVPILVEVKSLWNRRGAFEARIGDTLAGYRGPAAVMSFDTNCVAAFKERHPTLPRGMLGTRFAADKDWGRLGAGRRFVLRHLLRAFTLRPHFIAYDVKELPALAPWTARNVGRLPLLTWTVRNAAQRRTAERWADAMIFEGFRA